jgi:hypothetical protein
MAGNCLSITVGLKAVRIFPLGRNGWLLVLVNIWKRQLKYIQLLSLLALGIVG